MEVKIGKVYRHFKGNYYFVEGVALDSETKEILFCGGYCIRLRDPRKDGCLQTNI